MNRRRFLGCVAAAPVIAVVPAPARASDLSPFIERMQAVSAYEFPEWQAAVCRAIAAGMSMSYEKLAADFSA